LIGFGLALVILNINTRVSWLWGLVDSMATAGLAGHAEIEIADTTKIAKALVSSAVYGTPQRSSTGFDIRRLNMLLAVLEKRAGFKLGIKDVFLNITGGIKVNDPAIDLSIISAILSSNLDIPIGREVCFTGETGLSGEIRPVSRIEQRIKEASKMGFKKIYISKFHKDLTVNGTDIEIVQVGKIENLVRALFA
jgi:DNA repair protein RadA/Sms